MAIVQKGYQTAARPQFSSSAKNSAVATGTGGSGMKIIFPDLVKELATADAQPFGGFRAIAAANTQGMLNSSSLDLGKKGSERQNIQGIMASGNRGIGRILDIKVLRKDRPSPGGDHRAGQGIFKLSDISRPESLLDR